MKMALANKGTEPSGVDFEVQKDSSICFGGSFRISLLDFLIVAEEVFTAGNLLAKDDPRIKFIEFVKGLKVSTGHPVDLEDAMSFGLSSQCLRSDTPLDL